MFWPLHQFHESRPLYYDQNEWMTYGQLQKDIQRFDHHLASEPKKLAFLFCENSYSTIVTYLACLKHRHAVFLIDSKLDKHLAQHLVDIYRPEIMWFPDQADNDAFPDYQMISRDRGQLLIRTPAETHQPLHPDLAILLSTSGTTGSPKLVRLSYQNIQSNTQSIIFYLGITKNDRTITTLPFHYSYGLSILHSYFAAGASLVCTQEAVIARNFWTLFKDQQCTSLAGVPYTFEMLERLRFEHMDLPSLRVITQAGGRLSAQRIEYFERMANNKNIKFFVMYGQTEASPRISFVPPDRLSEKKDSIGIPIPGGVMSLYKDGQEIVAVNTEGELVYKGKNVMLGYAQSREELSLGDEQKGILPTGDLAYRDGDGYFYITGRLKRILKIYGLRVNLDDIEKHVELKLGKPAMCYGQEDVLNIAIESKDAHEAEWIKKSVIDLYHIYHECIHVQCVPVLPRTASGKKDYQQLKT